MNPVRSSLLDAVPWLRHGFGTRHNGAWTVPDRTARLHQVHAAAIVTVTEPGHHGDGDALIASSPNLWLEIRTADCVPVLIADTRQKVVAAVHAGWRGTAAGITGAAVGELLRGYGSRPEDLVAAVGPCIAVCCFEVGEEVASHFPAHTDRTAERPHVNLAAVNVEQLIETGVPIRNIDNLGRCTMCETDMFHSFRRDRAMGRMVSAIAIEPA
jgi:YfiH family protein